MPPELQARAVQPLNCTDDLRAVRPLVGVRGPAALDERPLRVGDERLRRAPRLVAFVDLDDHLRIVPDVMIRDAPRQDLDAYIRRRTLWWGRRTHLERDTGEGVDVATRGDGGRDLLRVLVFAEAEERGVGPPHGTADAGRQGGRPTEFDDDAAESEVAQAGFAFVIDEDIGLDEG
jgi:hypothetical protein